MTTPDLKQLVKDRYEETARVVRAGAVDTRPEPAVPVTGVLYDNSETSTLPAEALQASLGCGNPTALAQLRAGDTVLDLGCGGGIDVLLAAHRVGPTGRAYGLDTSDQMLALAAENKARSGLTNVEFLRGEIEQIPLPDASIDVIISNCVINLSTEKQRALDEAFRVLRAGGRFAISDIVLREALPNELRRRADGIPAFWVECVSGALAETEYRHKLAAAGFSDIDVQPTKIFDADDARAFLAELDIDANEIAEAVAGKVMSAFVKATKLTTPTSASA